MAFIQFQISAILPKALVQKVLVLAGWSDTGDIEGESDSFDGPDDSHVGVWIGDMNEHTVETLITNNEIEASVEHDGDTYLLTMVSPRVSR